jgi:CheY-like chemotaxis protein
MMEQPKNFMGNILVAEDDPDDRLFVKQALKETGFTGNLYFVNDGLELMKYLDFSKCQDSAVASARPDLILLDLYLPGKNGLEALQEIKAAPDLNGIKIVAMTGSEMLHEAKMCLRLGAECLMSKPTSCKSWVKMMDRVVGLMLDTFAKKAVIARSDA